MSAMKALNLDISSFSRSHPHNATHPRAGGRFFIRFPLHFLSPPSLLLFLMPLSPLSHSPVTLRIPAPFRKQLNMVVISHSDSSCLTGSSSLLLLSPLLVLLFSSLLLAQPPLLLQLLLLPGQLLHPLMCAIPVALHLLLILLFIWFHYGHLRIVPGWWPPVLLLVDAQSPLMPSSPPCVAVPIPST